MVAILAVPGKYPFFHEQALPSPGYGRPLRQDAAEREEAWSDFKGNQMLHGGKSFQEPALSDEGKR